MTTILVIWTIVAASPGWQTYDWRPIGVFVSMEHCQSAAVQLGATKYRCLLTGGNKQ